MINNDQMAGRETLSAQHDRYHRDYREKDPVAIQSFNIIHRKEESSLRIRV